MVYANYGRREDFDQLAKLGVDVKGKIVLVRYGDNFRGVKVYLAQQRGAVGVVIFSDPADDGYVRGDVYPRGAMRPESAVQRGSVQFLPIYPGDAETPGIASSPELPDAQRLTEAQTRQLPGGDQPSIPSNPLSYKDAAPILEALSGPAVPHDWQGGLPFTYHLGGSPAVTAHMALVQDARLRTIWDVVGTIDGADLAEKDNWVVAGNHRDAWVFGAVDPNSGTAAMLESVHGLGELLRQGWKPRRRIVICSWDAEEEGPDRLDRVGGAACGTARTRGRVLQHGCRGCGSGLQCIRCAFPEAVRSRRDHAGAEPARWIGVPAVAAISGRGAAASWAGADQPRCG